MLLVDFDPQSHATLGLGIDPASLGQGMYDVIISRYLSISDIRRTTSLERLTLAPTNIMLECRGIGTPK